MNERGSGNAFREYAPEFTLLEPVAGFEDRRIARGVREDLLTRGPDLAVALPARGRRLLPPGWRESR